MGAKEADMKEKVYDCGCLELKLKSEQAAISWGERVMRDSVEHVCTEYSLLLLTRPLIYRDLLNAVVANAEACEEYLGGYLSVWARAVRPFMLVRPAVLQNARVPPRLPSMMMTLLQLLSRQNPLSVLRSSVCQ